MIIKLDKKVIFTDSHVKMYYFWSKSMRGGDGLPHSNSLMGEHGSPPPYCTPLDPGLVFIIQCPLVYISSLRVALQGRIVRFFSLNLLSIFKYGNKMFLLICFSLFKNLNSISMLAQAVW